MGVQPLGVSAVPLQGVQGRSSNFDFANRRPVKTALFLLGDLLALGAAYYAATILAKTIFHVATSSLGPPVYPVFFVPFCAAIFCLMDGYGMADLRRPERELELAFNTVLFSLLCLLAANALFLKGAAFSRYFILLWFLLALGFVLCMRFSLRAAYSWARRRGRATSRALFIGHARELQTFRQLLAVQRHRAYHLVAAILPGAVETLQSAEKLLLLADLKSWEPLAETLNVQLIIIGRSQCSSNEALVREIMMNSCKRKLDVVLLADTFYPYGMHRELDHFTGSSYFSAASRWSRSLQQACKRTIDLFFGVLGSLLTLAITPVVGLLIAMEDPGRIFHLREFVSPDGEVRHYRKFRTMVQNADAILRNDPELRSRFADNHKLRDDPRVLRVGRILRKYSIDEFPQFFSLLSGRLSLVGPRVISKEETVRYGEFLTKRLTIKPGMTGYWQVMGRQTTTYEERIHMDEFYIDHWSIWLDLYIIGKTFGKLLLPEGAY